MFFFFWGVYELIALFFVFFSALKFESIKFFFVTLRCKTNLNKTLMKEKGMGSVKKTLDFSDDYVKNKTKEFVAKAFVLAYMTICITKTLLTLVVMATFLSTNLSHWTWFIEYLQRKG